MGTCPLLHTLRSPAVEELSVERMQSQIFPHAGAEFHPGDGALLTRVLITCARHGCGCSSRVFKRVEQGTDNVHTAEQRAESRTRSKEQGPRAKNHKEQGARTKGQEPRGARSKDQGPRSTRSKEQGPRATDQRTRTKGQSVWLQPACLSPSVVTLRARSQSLIRPCKLALCARSAEEGKGGSRGEGKGLEGLGVVGGMG